MIYLLHGPDTYRSRAKVREIIGEFQKKVGQNIPVNRIDAREAADTILDIGRTASLFSAKELLVVERISESTKEAQQFVLRQLPSWAADRDCTVIFWEEEMPASDALLKEIQKRAAKAQEFGVLNPSQLAAWLTQAAEMRKIRISADDKKLLLRRSEGDLWRLDNDLEKVASGWSVEGEAAGEQKIWDFTDTFFQNRRRAFRPLANLLANGFEPIYLVGALAGSLRALALVWWGRDAKKLAKAGKGMHPFVVRKNQEAAKGLTAAALERYFDDLVTADTELKTGKLPPPLPLWKLILAKNSK